MRPHFDLPLTAASGDPPADPPAVPRTRRAILAAALGGLAGSVASTLGRPAVVDAAAGGPLVLGQQNYAGSSATRLNTTSSGGAFWMTQNGSGSGVRGESWNGTGGVFLTHHANRQGLLVQQLGAAGTGAALRAEGGANTGVLGSTASPDGRGVTGYASHTTGVNYGVRGESASTDGFGVYGYASNASGPHYGVYGQAAGASGAGVSGYSGFGYGVFGSSSTGTGVYGYSNSSYAGYFSGTCYATSFTTVLSPTVRLDHPLAPATKVLAHAAIVSDEAATLYSGIVTTDAAGEATVGLSDWFEALNRDLRYQLTPLGAAMPDLHVSRTLSDGSFSIAGASPAGQVSWQLTGVRADAYAKAHPLQVESTKTDNEKGRYLTPLELGQPESKGVDWEARQRIRGDLAPAEA